MTSANPTRRPPPLSGPLGRLASRVYGAEIARRNRRFDAGHGVMRLPVPAISVGNLSVGGTGKTPMVCTILAQCAGSAGCRPCVAMRGYRAGAEGSDEAMEYAQRFPDVPIVAQPDRGAGLLTLLASDQGRDIRLIVLDDGFQHRQIARDLDIVLLDATRDPFEDALLPAGWLREPVQSLRRAHVAIVTHAEAAPAGVPDAIIRRALAINPRLATAVSSHVWDRLLSSHPDGRFPAGLAPLAPTDLAGRRVFVACAIGNPAPFLAAAEKHIRAPSTGVFLRPDHDPYTPATVRSLVSAARNARAEFILTTQKDWSKLARVPDGDWPCPVLRPRLIMRFDSGGEEVKRAIADVARRD